MSKSRIRPPAAIEEQEYRGKQVQVVRVHNRGANGGQRADEDVLDTRDLEARGRVTIVGHVKQCKDLTAISEIGVRASLRSGNPKNPEIPGVRTRFEHGLLGRSNLYVETLLLSAKSQSRR